LRSPPSVVVSTDRQFAAMVLSSTVTWI